MRRRVFVTMLLIGFFGVGEAQKGEKSIAAGPLISFPVARDGISYLKIGVGLEAIGQYNFSKNSALLLKTTLASWRYTKAIIVETKRLTFLTVQGGYKYQFASGFFINGLVGYDIDLYDGFKTISFTLGAGKRFILKDEHFIDAGIDLVGGDADGRINIKAVYSVFQWLK